MNAVRRAEQADVPAWRTLAEDLGEVDDLAWLARLDDAIDEGRAWQALDLEGRMVGGMVVVDDGTTFRVVWLGGDADDLLAHARLLAAPREVTREG